jgi:peptide/nickel transport system substrate-binding protein
MLSGQGNTGNHPLQTVLVKAGKIPSVTERLPVNPMVAQATEVGMYCSEFTLIANRGDKGRYTLLAAEMPWFEPDPANINNIRPAMAESVEVSDDAREYTITLRKGLKWSDGHPYTSEDVEFFFEELINNEEINGSSIPLPDSSFRTVTVDVINSETFVLKFANPNGLALQQMATIGGKSLVTYAKHYASQFLTKYNSKVKAQAEEAGFTNVAEYFAAKCPSHWSHGTIAAMPVLSAWMATEDWDETDNAWTVVRNPYYWRVDQDGRQLPYMDKLKVLVSDDLNSVILRVANGEVDFRYQLGGLSAKPVLMQNADRAGIKVFDIEQDWGPNIELGWNLNTDNKALHEIVNQKDFRIAMSVAINRPEINEGLFLGTSEPFQMSPKPETSLYDPEFSSMYIEYDPVKANQLLDGLGLNKRDSAGYRLLKNGERLSFVLNYNSNQNAWITEIYEYIKSHWKEVGVELIMSPSKTTSQIRNSGDFDFWAQTGPNNWIFLNPKGFLPVNNSYFVDGGHWVAYWRYMLTGVKEDNMLEPPANVKKGLELYRKVLAASSQEEAQKDMEEIIALAKDNFYKIGILKGNTEVLVFTKEMHNIPSDMLKTWTKSAPQFTQPYTWWKEGTALK